MSSHYDTVTGGFYEDDDQPTIKDAPSSPIRLVPRPEEQPAEPHQEPPPPVEALPTPPQAPEPPTEGQPDDFQEKLKALTDSGMTLAQALDALHMEAETGTKKPDPPPAEPEPERRCDHCKGKNKQFSIRRDDLTLCSADYKSFRKRVGKRYSELIGDPKAVLAILTEISYRAADNRDMAKVGKTFSALMTSYGAIGLTEEEIHQMFNACEGIKNYFAEYFEYLKGLAV